MTKKRLAILTGGTSAERDIALASAKTVADLLAERYDITKFDFPSEIDAFLAQRDTFDVAIPIFHGKGGEDGTVQGFLKTLGVPFLFSDVTAHAIGMDKTLAKTVVSTVGLHTPSSIVLTRVEFLQGGSPSFQEGARGSLGMVRVVKPLDSGSTLGITIVRSSNDLQSALENAFKHSDKVLIEDFIGGDEFTVAVIDEHGESIALPVIQIVSPNGIYDHSAKYGPQPAEKLCPAPISEDLTLRLQESAVTAHKAIGARHLSRTDFIVDREGTIWFLEINTIPGQSVLFPKAVKASGRDFAEIFADWIESVYLAKSS
ncbi:MAG: D-alanine--D-alanine ligase [Patescibacteria group bacterium]|jgi:D-alanine-D-alanine ligase